MLVQRPVAGICARVRADDEELGCWSLLFGGRELSAAAAGPRPATLARPFRARGLSLAPLKYFTIRKRLLLSKIESLSKAQHVQQNTQIGAIGRTRG